MRQCGQRGNDRRMVARPTAAALSMFASLAVASASLADDRAEYAAFLQRHRGGVERAPPSSGGSRFDVFVSSLRNIERLNARGGGLETHAVNEFADLTDAEFEAAYLGGAPEAAGLGWRRAQPDAYTQADGHGRHAGRASRRLLGETIDWREEGALTPVKNQGGCGSCWAFAAVSEIESAHFIANGELLELSTQQVTSCTYGFRSSRHYSAGRDGCNGGRNFQAMNGVADFGGVMPEAALPYQGNGFGCQEALALRDQVAVRLEADAYWEIGRDEHEMVRRLQTSTIAIALSASGLFKSYSSGVIRASSGCPTNVNHAVQLVGYNAAGNYFIVRNSWGRFWGQGGFVYIEAGSNVCGMGGYGVGSNVMALKPAAPPSPSLPPFAPPWPPSPPTPPPPPLHPGGPVPDALIAFVGLVALLGGGVAPVAVGGPEIALGGSDGLSLAAWVRRAGHGSGAIGGGPGQALFHCSNGDADVVRLSFDDTFTFATGSESQDELSVGDAANFPAWVWTHVVVSQDRHGTTTLYLNGTNVASGQVTIANPVARADCFLGRGAGWAAAAPPFRGEVRGFYAVNRPLEERAIQLLSQHLHPYWLNPPPPPATPPPGAPPAPPLPPAPPPPLRPGDTSTRTVRATLKLGACPAAKVAFARDLRSHLLRGLRIQPQRPPPPPTPPPPPLSPPDPSAWFDASESCSRSALTSFGWSFDSSSDNLGCNGGGFYLWCGGSCSYGASITLPAGASAFTIEYGNACRHGDVKVELDGVELDRIRSSCGSRGCYQYPPVETCQHTFTATYSGTPTLRVVETGTSIAFIERVLVDFP